MWDTGLSEWNAVKMGPKRDVVGELEKAIRNQGMRFMVALHHAENWWFFPHWRKEFDTSDPKYSGLYGEAHNLEGNIGEGFFARQAKPSKAFLELWYGKTIEVIDKYRPDLLWFDFGIHGIHERYKMDFLAYYYNKAREWKKEVAVTYKWDNMVSGAGVIDLELGRMGELTPHDWITDTTVDAGQGWGYLRNTGYKSVTNLIHYLIDNVSKNGYLLLNVGPKPNGEIPDEAKEILIGMGEWLEVNGEAIYGTTPWLVFGEGPTKMEKSGAFMEDKEVEYTAKDIRFTAKDNVLYAICLGRPTEPVKIEYIKEAMYASEIKSITMLGVNRKLKWSLTPEGLTIIPPEEKPCEHASVFKISRRPPF
jgi:alpha-L-fucosidase